MTQIKTNLKPAELAALVRRNMENSAAETDLSALVNMDQLEQMMIEIMRETQFNALMHTGLDTKH